MAIKVILDTDIGDDIDDALALGLICASPEIQLIGITTVFGNVSARARQARTLLKVAGQQFTHIPVAVGCGASMSSRPVYNHIQRYLENHLPNQDSTCLPENELPPNDKRHAVNFLIDTIMNGDGDIIPVMIGALTNLATAMVMERKIVAKIPRLVIMAAEFKRHMGEYNILCDPEAAHLVFSSGIPIDLITWDIGHTVRFAPEHIAQLASGNSALTKRLSAAITAWQKVVHYAGNPPMPSLFDPMTIATMITPELTTWKRGRVSVELTGSHTYGYTHFKESADGPHRVAWDADRNASLAFYLQRLLKFPNP